MKKTVTVFAATGVAGSACVNELIRQDVFKIRVLARKQGQQEKTSFRPLTSTDAKQKQYQEWQAQSVEIRSADVTDHAELVPALEAALRNSKGPNLISVTVDRGRF